MKHLGDITKINGYTVAPVNVVIGGSPCQDLSIAGNRAGLAGERSGLFMEQIRIIKEMRDADAARGRTGRNIRPRWMVWENVPGAFSSNKGEDFGAVIRETIKVACPQAPAVSVPKNGWPTSGCLADMGGKWSVAWRVFDAQFWGVPQRRRRIALVADFGGLTAPEILFERKGVFGDSEQGGAPWKAFAAAAEGRTAEAGYGGPTYCIQGNCIDRADTAGCNGRGWTEGVSYTLNTVDRPAVTTVVCLNDQSGSRMGVSVDKAGTLRAQEHGHQPIVCMASGQAHAEISTELSPTLSCNHEQPIVAQQLFENHGQDSRLTGPLEVAPTVAQKFGTGGNNTPLVVGFKYHQGAGARGLGEEEGISPALCADGGHPPAVATFQNTGIGWWNESDIGATLRTPCGGDSTKANLVVAVDCRNGTENPETNGTLQAKSNGGTSLNLNNVVREGTLVRRLTPLECERLQGFPDGWTDIGPWTDSKGKVHKESSDAARYKALGNSIALPSWAWVLSRLSLCAAAEPTMASLFDGIGGFPLLWEWLNGKGSCLWASEIEEFPIAVTKYHFGCEESEVNND
jgi:DNA (cytosine-5)-methyltransferase 1